MSFTINWERTLERLQTGMNSVVDWERREGYVFDCAMILSDRLGRIDDARALLVSVGTERPSHRLATRLSDLLLRQGDWTGAYDWSLEALALADTGQLQMSRIRCATIGMDYLSNRVEAKAYLRDYIEDGGREIDALERLQRLTPDTDVDEKVELLTILLAQAITGVQRRQYQSDLLLLCEVSKAHWSQGLELFLSPEMDDVKDRKLILSAYRMARRLDQMDLFNETLSARGLTLPNESTATIAFEPSAEAAPASSAESSLRALILGEAKGDVWSWMKAAVPLFGARVVSIAELVADALPTDKFRAQIDLMERALEIAVNDLDLEYFPTSTYQLLGDGLCGVVGAGGLRIRAEQMGNRFPQLRHLSLCLAGFESLGQSQMMKAESCFLEASKIQPLGRAEARASRLIAWQKNDLDAVRSGLEREIEVVPYESRRDLQVELALVEESVGQLDRAEALYRKVIKIARDWLPAAYGLGTLLDRQGRWRELAAFVDDELMSTGANDGRDLALIGRLAEIYEHHLDQLDSAADLYERILRHKPSAPDAILGLVRIYERQGRWNALVLLLESLGTVYETPRARAIVLYKAAEIAEFRMNDLAIAVPLYKAAFNSGVDPVFGWALEAAVLKSQNRHELFSLYQSDSNLAQFDVDVRRALSLSPSEALDSVESLMESDQHPIWAWLFAQLSCELQRPAHVAEGINAFASRMGPSQDQTGLVYEAFCQRLANLAPSERLEILSKVEVDSPVGALVFQDLLSIELSEPVLNVRLLHLLDWRLSGRHSSEQSDVLSLARYLVTVTLEGEASAGDWAFTRSTEEPSRWIQHVQALTAHRHVEPGMRASALLSLAHGYKAHPSAGVRAFEAGRLFEQSNHLPQAVQSYRLALKADPDLLAAASGLVSLVGIATTPDSVFRTLFEATARSSSDAHRVSLLGTLLKEGLTFDGEIDRAKELLETLADLNAVFGFERQLAMHYLASNQTTKAVPLLEGVLKDSNDLESLIWSAVQLGELALLDGANERAIELFRKAVGLEASTVSLSGLSVAYLKNGDSDLARLSYRRLEGLGERGGLEFELEGRLGRMVALCRMNRLEAAKLLLADLPDAQPTERSQFLLTSLSPELKSQVPVSLIEGRTGKPPRTVLTSSTSVGAGWMLDAQESEPTQERERIEIGWRLQRQGWFQGSLITAPELSRTPNALKRSVIEALLPEHIHPSLVDSLAVFGRLNDLYGTDISGPLAPLTPLETQRLRILCDAIGVGSFELRLDPVNAFRLDCKSGSSPCVVMGEGLFEAVSVDQLEFLVGWSLVCVHMGAMPAHFMRAARRFGPKDLESVLRWIQTMANGGTGEGTLAQTWQGADDFRRQLIDVIEWTSAHSMMDAEALYTGLQTYGLRLAFSLATCFGVSMETIRLIEMDDRTLDLLSIAQRQEAVERSATLRELDGFSQNADCIWARQQLFTLKVSS